jgi:hypothetical protein
VGQQVPNGDGAPVGREFREESDQRVIVAQLPIAHQQHRGGGSELLSQRGQP